MAVRELVSENSEEYKKILSFNDPKNPLMRTAPGQKIDCYIDEAYAYLTKNNDLVIAIVPKVQFAVNMVGYPHLAGQYIVNDITGVDTASRPYKYQIDHRNKVSLNTLNHIIDLNRPDVLDPQTIFDNQLNFKAIVNEWHDHNWVKDANWQKVLRLPDRASDLVPDELVDGVLKHAGFKSQLSKWREENWISEDQARQFARSGKPIKTIDDELSFRIAIKSIPPKN